MYQGPVSPNSPTITEEELPNDIKQLKEMVILLQQQVQSLKIDNAGLNDWGEGLELNNRQKIYSIMENVWPLSGFTPKTPGRSISDGLFPQGGGMASDFRSMTPIQPSQSYLGSQHSKPILPSLNISKVRSTREKIKIQSGTQTPRTESPPQNSSSNSSYVIGESEINLTSSFTPFSNNSRSKRSLKPKETRQVSFESVGSQGKEAKNNEKSKFKNRFCCW